MSYSENHIYFKLQSIVFWRQKHVCDDFDRRVLQIRFVSGRIWPPSGWLKP